MKRILALFIAVFCGIMLSAAEPAVKSLKILAIGNSFTNSVVRQLNNIVAADPTCEMKLEQATLGGCSLERHWREHLKSEADPNYKSYSGKKYSLREKLTMDKWDIVIFQQVSHLSWQPESYEPYAGNLIKLIRELAPTAEIVIQQIWSYNAADARLKSEFNPGTWKHNGKTLDQTMMYDLLTDAYNATAKKYNLQIVPSGYAMQLYRKSMGDKLVSIAPKDYKKLEKTNLPTTNDIVGSYSWRKKKNSEEIALYCDNIHLNPRGQYLQALVWYAALFGKDPEASKYQPKGIKADEAKHFRSIAKKAVKEFPQVKK